MPFKYYEPAQPADLNPAYEMLFRAAEERRARMAAVPGQVADALNTFVRSKQVDRELDQRAQSIGDERQYRDKSSARADEELDLEKRRFQSDEDERQRFATALGGVMGGRQPATVGSVPVNRDTAFDPFGTNRGPRLDASAILGGQRGSSAPAGGGDEFDMSQLAGIKPEHVSTIFSMLDRMHDNKRQEQAAQAKVQQDQREAQDYSTLVTNGEKSKLLSKEEATAYRLRGSDPTGRREASDELTKRIHTEAERLRGEGEFAATLKATEKRIKTDFAEKPDKIGQWEALKSIFEHSALPPAERAKSLQEELSKLYGVGKAKEKDPGVDLPGIGQNITLNTSLGKPGEYMIAPDGSPVLPSDADSELTLLAKKSLENDPAFSNRLLSLMDSSPTTVEGFSKLKENRESALRDTKLQILGTLGWKPKGSSDPIKAMDLGSADMEQASAQPGATTAPQALKAQDIEGGLDAAIKSGAVKAGDADSIKAWLQKNVTPDQAQAALGSSQPKSPNGGPQTKGTDSAAADESLRPQYIRQGPSRSIGQSYERGNTESGAAAVLREMAQKVGAYYSRDQSKTGRIADPYSLYEQDSGALEQAIGEYEAVYGAVPKSLKAELDKLRQGAK